MKGKSASRSDKSVSYLHVRDVEWAYREVERQHDLSARHVAGMCEALVQARMCYSAPITPEFLRQLNWCIKGIGKWRMANLDFPPTASEWHQVPEKIEHLCAHGGLLTPREWIYEFLHIHPHIDGNGRSAAIILNYLSGTLAYDRLQPLPEWEELEEIGKQINRGGK